MSRIGKQPIIIPQNTEVNVEGNTVRVKGPLGEVSRSFHNAVLTTVSDGEVVVRPAEKTLFSQALWGTVASHIRNMVEGVNKSFEKRLIIEGVGYRAEVSGNDLVLIVGFSHNITLPIPDGIEVAVQKNTITISGINKESVGHFAALVRSYKKPEPYKGKGIRYEDEVVRRKQGKRAV
ncbi:50S ribosomal protein L6 [bacterium]|nr:50S ribosomal protein L6 [bacterium]|tara:strand:+ start:3361 stop:3894 length:534 start_codon:yes stop_codon:yes gene_type:complete